MNQEQLVNVFASQVDVSKATSEAVLKTLGRIVADELKNGGEVVLPGIGKLSVKTRAARSCRNPQTGESMQIPAKNVVHLSVAKSLKDVV